MKFMRSQVKGYMVRCNRTKKHLKVHQLVEAGLGEITAEGWQGAVRRGIQDEQRMWKLIGLISKVVGQLDIVR
jgi:hypothetical protein